MKSNKIARKYRSSTVGSRSRSVAPTRDQVRSRKNRSYRELQGELDRRVKRMERLMGKKRFAQSTASRMIKQGKMDKERTDEAWSRLPKTEQIKREAELRTLLNSSIRDTKSLSEITRDIKIGGYKIGVRDSESRTDEDVYDDDAFWDVYDWITDNYKNVFPEKGLGRHQYSKDLVNRLKSLYKKARTYKDFIADAKQYADDLKYRQSRTGKLTAGYVRGWTKRR